MDSDSAFLNSIPKFLRRPQAPDPAKLKGVNRLAAPAAPRPPRSDARPARVIHGGVPPVQPRFAAPGSVAPRQDATPGAPGIGEVAAPARPTALPWLARRKPERPDQPPAGDPGPPVVALNARRAAGAPEQTAAHRMQAEIESAFDGELDPCDDDDAAFQVTLPRSVIRQIRLRAAEEGTTHRAIVLRALRAAGVSVPTGADIDRRAVAAKRRQPA